MDYFYKYKGQDIRVSLNKKLSFIDLNNGSWIKYVNNLNQIKNILQRMKQLIDEANKKSILKTVILVFLSLYLLKCSHMDCGYTCTTILVGHPPKHLEDYCYPKKCEEPK
jgi:hypothetical protein